MLELELELIQTHMEQKPMLRVGVGARFVAQSGWKRGMCVAVGTCKRVRAVWGRVCVHAYRASGALKLGTSPQEGSSLVLKSLL